MRYGKLMLRLLGTLIVASGVLIIVRGGAPYNITIKDIVIPVPSDLLLIVVGTLLLLHPTFWLHLLALFVGENRARRLTVFADQLDAIPSIRINDLDSPETVARRFNDYVERSTRRFYLAWATVGLLMLIVLPMLFFRIAGSREYDQAGKTMAILVQQVRLDFNTADQFRSALQLARAAVDAHRTERGPTVDLYGLLSRLYGPEVATPEQYDRYQAEIYNTRVSALSPGESGVLDLRPLQTGAMARGPAYQRIAVLTTLALVSNPQGDDGGYVVPFLEARQFARAALAESSGTTLTLSGTWNALGVAFAGVLKAYGKYDSLMTGLPPGETKALLLALGDEQRLSKLDLALRADEAYQKAREAATSNYARARFLNNHVDLMVTLMERLHLQGDDFLAQSRSASMANELARQLGAGALDKGADATKKLVPVLQGLESALDSAATLSMQPQILMTKAMLYSLGGRLTQRYALRDTVWGDTSVVRSIGINTVAAAVAMHLSTHRLDEARIQRDGIEWLFQGPGGAERLVTLRRAALGGSAP